MNRTLVAVGIGMIAASVLVTIAMQSRSVSADVHIAQNSVSADTAFLAEDFRALLSTLQSDWESKQQPSEAANSLADRMAAIPNRMQDSVFAVPGSSGQEARIRNTFIKLAATADQTSALANELIADLTAYARSVAILRTDGPAIVQRLRDRGLGRAAADTFQLVVGSLSFATEGDPGLEMDMRRLQVTLARDQQLDGNLSRALEPVSRAADQILDQRANIESKLEQLAMARVAMDATNLDLAVQDTYLGAVSRADRARWMLAAYSLALLGAVVYVGFRLKESYREINNANTQLAALNETLEQRVKDRTEELEGTLADLKESQVQLVQAEKMSSLGQLVAGISHEINTPLLYLANNVVLIRERLVNMRDFVRRSMVAGTRRPEEFESREAYQRAYVKGLAAVMKSLKDDALEDDIEEAIDLLEDCDEGLKDLTEMAQSLKDFSRLDRAPVENFDINAGLDKTLRIAKNIVKHKAEVIKNYGDIPEISCSPSQINQVFLNLVTNAAQAIEGSGRITLTTARQDEHYVAISIRDTGCGIPADIMDKIRDPFFTTKEVGTGTGLGLSIVEEIIRGHGGRLLIESVVGEGSVFTVLLPVKPHRNKPNPKAKNGRTEHVDDASHGLARAS